MNAKFDLKIQKTYLALIAAFEKLMKEKSIDELTVNELCQEAAIGRNTFYSHFEDKYSFFQYYVSLRKQMIEDISADVGDDFLEFRVRCGQELFKYFKENRYIWEKNLSAASGYALKNLVQDNVKAPLIEELTNLEKATGKKVKVSKTALASFYAGGLIDVFIECLSNHKLSEEDVIRDIEIILKCLFSDELFE